MVGIRREIDIEHDLFDTGLIQFVDQLGMMGAGPRPSIQTGKGFGIDFDYMNTSAGGLRIDGIPRIMESLLQRTFRTIEP